MMNKNQEALKQVAAVHRANLQKNVQHRLEVARAKGDDRLVKMLEAEASYLG